MKSITKSKLPWLATFAVLIAWIATMISCGRLGTQVSVADQNPFEQISRLSAGIKPAGPSETAQAQCLAKQRARLEGCGKESGEQRAICEAVAKELIKVCEEMNPNAPAYLASSLFCSGACALKQCPAGCPIPGGTGTCLGAVCANPNRPICDPGVLFDCHCETNVAGPPITATNFCSCSCQ